VFLFLFAQVASARAQDAYVADQGANAVSVVNTQTNEVVGSPIEVGERPAAIAITPDGKTAYVVNSGSHNISAVNTQTKEVVGSPITVGMEPDAIAITPNGSYAYVTNHGSHNVSVVNTQTNEVVGSPIEVGERPAAIAITPDGKTAYVVNSGSHNISAVNTQTNEVVGSPIEVGGRPTAIAITPDGKTAYVVNAGSHNVSVVNTQTNEVVGSPISVGMEPDAIAITPNGSYAYVTNHGSNTVSVFGTATDELKWSIEVGERPDAVALVSNGEYAYVANQESSSVSVIYTPWHEAVSPSINVGEIPTAITIVPDQPPFASFNVSKNSRAGIPMGFSAIPSGYPEPSTSQYEWGYEWEFGDGTKQAGPSALYHTYATPGTYEATLTVTDSVCSSEFIFTGQTAYCNGSAPKRHSHQVVVAAQSEATSVAVSLSPSSIVADGSSTTTATAKVTDAKGNPVSGDEIQIYTGNSAAIVGPVSETSAGTYSATITSSRKASSPRVTVEDSSVNPSVTGYQTLTQTAGPATNVSVWLSPRWIGADGSSTTTATAKVTDANGNPVPGSSVSLATTDPGEKIGPVGEPSTGIYSATITSSTTVGEPTITATDSSVSPNVSGYETLLQTAGELTESAVPQYAYVTSGFGSDTVSTIDTKTNQVVGSPISFSREPRAVAITPDGKTAYVAGWNSNSVLAIDTQTDEIVGSPIRVGEHPGGIAITPDGRYAYVTNEGALGEELGSVSVIDTETNEVVGSPITVGKRPDGIAITPDGKHAYVANNQSGSVSVIDTETNEVVGSPITVGNVPRTPREIAITPNGKFAYVTGGESDVSVIDTQTNKEVGSPILVGDRPEGIAITPDGRRAYVADGLGFSVIDTQTNQAVSETEIGEFPDGVAITPDGKVAYIGYSGHVSVVNTRSNQVVGSPINVGSNATTIAITPDQPAVAAFSVPTHSRPGVLVSLNASASAYPEGSIPSFDWKFGDGTSKEDNVPTVSHTYNSPGTYEVTLTVTDGVCSSESIFTGQTAYCNGSAPVSKTRQIIVAGPGPATSVVVSLSPLSIIANGSSISTATAKVTDAKGNPVPADDLSFSSTDLSQRISPVSELSEGTYTATITSSTTAGEPRITATDNSVDPSVAGNAILTQTKAIGKGGEHACLASFVPTSCGPPFRPLSLKLEGNTAPRNLSEHEMAPVTLKLAARISTRDGTPPPALRQVTVDFDQSGAVNVTGLPICRRSQLESSGIAAARRICRRSVVGTGTASVNISASQQPISIPLKLFNGGVSGKTTTMFIQSSIPGATPTPILAIVRLTKINLDGYGLQAVATIPRIADEGSLHDFNLQIHRLFRYKGTEQSYAVARCRNHELNATVSTTFSDGSHISSDLTQACKPKD